MKSLTNVRTDAFVNPKFLRCTDNQILVNLRNRTREERRGKPCVTNVTIICLKKLSAKFHFPLNRSFCKRQGKKLMLSEDHDKHSIKSPVTFVSNKRFAVLFSLLTCCLNSLLSVVFCVRARALQVRPS